MEKQVSDQVQRGVYLAARMASDFEVSREHYDQTFPGDHVELGKRDHAPACASYCVDGGISDPFNVRWNMSLVDRNIAGKLAETPLLQFAHEDRDVHLAICAGHDDCLGINEAITELRRLYDQVDEDPDVIQERISRRCAEMNRAIHPKEKLIYRLLCSGGVDIYEALKQQPDVKPINAAMAEEWARQQIYFALENELVYNLVRQGRLVLASSMVHFPDEHHQETNLNMIVAGDGEELAFVHGSDIIEVFEGVVSDAFLDSDGTVDRDQMMKRCDSMWVSDVYLGTNRLKPGDPWAE
jgi:hypothetical protein